MTAIRSYAESCGFPLVVKPLKGTGGNLVCRATNMRELEAAVLKVWQVDYGVAVSPFAEISDEIRVVVLLGEARLVYRKRRPSVVGDGISTVQELIARELVQSQHPRGLCEAASSMTLKFLRSVPDKGESVLLEWRHNLGLGAVAEQIHSPAAVEVALAAAEALNMKFCSVDVVRLRDDSMAVLEINSGVMMDAFMESSSENRSCAREIYASALRYSLGS